MLEPKPGETPADANAPNQKEYKPTPAEEGDGYTPGTQNPDDAKKDE